MLFGGPAVDWLASFVEVGSHKFITAHESIFLPLLYYTLVHCTFHTLSWQQKSVAYKLHLSQANK